MSTLKSFSFTYVMTISMQILTLLFFLMNFNSAQADSMIEPHLQCDLLGGVWDECGARDWGAYCLDDEGQMHTHRDAMIVSCEAGCICPEELVFDGEDCVSIETLLAPCTDIDEPLQQLAEMEIESEWGDGFLSADEFDQCAIVGGHAKLGERCEKICFSAIDLLLNVMPTGCTEEVDYCECALGREFVDGECQLIESTDIYLCEGGSHTLEWNDYCGTDHQESERLLDCELVCDQGLLSPEKCIGNVPDRDSDDRDSEARDSEARDSEALEGWATVEEPEYESNGVFEEQRSSPSLSLKDQIGCDASGKVATHHFWVFAILSLLCLQARHRFNSATTDQSKV